MKKRQVENNNFRFELEEVNEDYKYRIIVSNIWTDYIETVIVTDNEKQAIYWYKRLQKEFVEL